jgi:hypothetical protein
LRQAFARAARAMKRLMEAGDVMLNEMMTEITKWIQSPSYIDVKTFVHWHQTCRQLWRMYSTLSCKELMAILASKYKFIETNLAASKYYEIYYQYALLDTFHTLQGIIDNLDIRLADVQKNIKLSNYCNPLAKICKIGDLNEFNTKLFIVSNGNLYGYNLFMHAITWIKLRYGWDVRLANVGGLGIINILPLDTIPKSHETYILVACNSKYHK